MQLKVSVIDIFYKSEKGFMVGNSKILETPSEYKEYENTTITFSGEFPELLKDNTYMFYGLFVNHPKYGDQFKVDNCEKIMPEGKSAIVSFLSSGIFPKVGIKTAVKIVDKLGEGALDLIIDNYNNLLTVPNMTEKRAIDIYNILKQEKESYKVVIYLQDTGFTFNEATKIYKIYKSNSLDNIDKNIYSIVEDVKDIGFLTVDKIAISMNIQKDDIRRIYACIIYCIYDFCMSTGSTYVNSEDIYLRICDVLGITLDIKTIEDYLFNLNKQGKIIIIDDKYYLRDFYECEVYISNRVVGLLSVSKDKVKKMDNYINMLENLFNIKYNKLQKEAIISSVENNFTIITGGPGTGKTTIIKGVVELYKNIACLSEEGMCNDIALLAPTGRAAKRIKEATGFNASTIHRFLKFNKETNDFGINKNNRSEAKFLIVDEASMIDMFLFRSLLEGLNKEVKIVLVGDYNQLPSILPGEILKDLIGSNKVPLIELNELYRQKEDSYIVEFANEIKDGKLKDFESKKSDYSFIKCDKYNIENMIVEVCKKAIVKNYSYKEIQVLIPMYKGINGIDNINIKLQEVFNPKDKSKREIEYNKVIFRENDKVLQTKNISDYDVSNGDIGIIKHIGDEKDNHKILIDFDGECVEYTKTDLENVKLGYAISIHKAQGSEFDCVILPMDLSFNRMLYRKLVYTGVTRAKKLLILIGEPEALLRGVDNISNDHRKTTLNQMIK